MSLKSLFAAGVVASLFATQAQAIQIFHVDIQGNGNAGFGQSNPALLQAGPDAQWGMGTVWNAFNVPAHNLCSLVTPPGG